MPEERSFNTPNIVKMKEHSFETTAMEDEKKEEKLAKMYQKYLLDPIIDAAFAISHDFSLRPHVYKEISVTYELVLIRRLTGVFPTFPNKKTRIHELYCPFFGKFSYENPLQDQNSGFVTSMKSLIDAAKAFSERGSDPTERALKIRVQNSAKRLRTYLKGRIGSSQLAAYFQIEELFEIATKILFDPTIGSYFGVVGRLAGNWPLEDDPDSNGAILMEEIFTDDHLINYLPQPTTRISAEKFGNLQLIANAGKKSIEGILNQDDKDDKRFKSLIDNLYTWGSELGIIHQTTK